MKTEQAEVLATSYAGLVNDRLATKNDIQLLKDDLTALKTELQKDMQVLEQRFDGRIDGLEQRMNSRMAYAQVATVTVLSAVMALLAFFGP